ncbi:MAG: hypothetical protein KDA66_16265, partial [Planctomycetaceae bacterium]|nr:hypothetical protein [Planctomycetaceae bacterium]
MRDAIPVFCLLFVFSTSLTSQAAEAEETSLAAKASQILQQRCYRCHGGAAKQAGIDVLSRKNLTQERGDIGARFALVVPGDTNSSQLLDSVAGGADSYMPQNGSPEAKAMTEEEKELLVKWVAAGAEFPRTETREFLTETAALAAMRQHLLDAKADDRRDIRFLTFTHWHNNPSISELDLRLARAALAKAINSLTHNREIILPTPLDGTNDAVFVINLRELGWDRNQLWEAILGQYPYALKYDFVKDEELKQTWKDVVQFSGADMPLLRADWFVVTATQPPLYHRFLDIPDTLAELEQQLRLDIQQNFLDGEVQRSGFAKSGVSKQNRLLERHTSPATPYFWISYDFLPQRAKGDLSRFPLGPPFADNPFLNQSFEHDGGEIIWSLPNGMQAYMLVNAKGNRIDEGPIDVVFDRSAVLGTPKIINGISCMYCHRDGMIT